MRKTLTVNSVSDNEKYIYLQLQIDEDECELELMADYCGTFWLSVYNEYIRDFPSFGILDYYSRTLIAWICDHAEEIMIVAKARKDRIDYDDQIY